MSVQIITETSMSSDNIESSVWEIKDKTLTFGARTAFSNANRFLIYKSNESSKADNGFNFFHEVKWNNSLHNCYTRKLVNESHGVFLSAIKLTKDLQDTVLSQDVMKISQKYRSVLLACMEDFDNATENSNSVEDYANQREMFSEIELIWSLIEVLLIDKQSRCLVLYKLLEWIQWHFPEAEKKVGEIMNSEEPCEHSSYWDTVHQFVLQGKITSARSLLRIHKSGSREDFLSMDELLKKMPMYSADVGFSLNEFLMRWRHWQEECNRRLEEGEFSAVTDLEILCKILCGDKDILTEKSYLCITWYHLLISVLLYTDPCILSTELGPLARTYSSNVNSDAHLSELDSIILAAMEIDIMTVIKNSCYFQDGWWFVAHITDLLCRGDHINTISISHPYCLQEFLLSNYAESLMTHRSLWQIGVDYLDQCPEVGRDYLELYLERIPIDTETKARKILYLAKQRNLDNLVKSVCKVMTVKAIKNENFGTALGWVVQSKDVRFATDLANRWIKEYSETGKFECFEILNNLGFCMLVSDKLTFIGKYCEFHKLYQDREFKSAASLLVSLLSSGLVPKTFQMVMLLDALPLLEAAEPMFSTQETCQLIACLEGLSENDDKVEGIKGLKKKERLIRLALGRNLARAFIQENSLS